MKKSSPREPLLLAKFRIMRNIRNRIKRGKSRCTFATYIDTLPCDIRAKIIEYLASFHPPMNMGTRHLRTIPESTKRIRFLSLLFAEGSPFRDAASTVFTEFSLAQMYACTEVVVSKKRITLGPELFDSERHDSDLAEQVLKACAESIKTISFGMNMPNELFRETFDNHFIDQFTSFVVKYCHNVENLEFASPSPGDNFAPMLFAAFSSQLRSVKCNLWKFDLSFPIGELSICPNIRELSAPASLQLIELLRSHGSTLESLSVKFGDTKKCDEAPEASEVLDIIQENCKNLTNISLSELKNVLNAVGVDRYVELLCSYGEQLVKAEVKALPLENMREVAEGCPNLKVELLKVDQSPEAWKRVSIFGPRLRHLMIDMRACRDEESLLALEKCTNLAELTSYSFDGLKQDHRVLNDAIMTLLSPLTRDSLERLHLLHFIASQKVIAKIVATTSKLKMLWILPEGPIPDVNVFRPIVERNPHLHYIHIEEDVSYDRGREAPSAVRLLRSLLDIFSNCDTMFFGILNTGFRSVSLDTVRYVCGGAACRGINIKVRINTTCYEHCGRTK